MDLIVYFVGIVIFISASSAFHENPEDYYDYTDDGFSPNPPLSTKPTSPPLGRYEVTEIVDDIPNPNVAPVLLATNVTVNKPLNVVNTTNVRKGVSTRENPKFRKDFAVPNNTGKESPKDVIVNDFEYAHEPDYEFDYDGDDHGFPNILPIIKKYLSGLQKGIVNGVNGVVGKNVFNSEYSEPSRSSTPDWFLNKLKDRKIHSYGHTHCDHEYDDIKSH